MAFLPALITGISGLAGGLLNRPSTQQQQTNQTTNQQSSQSTANQSQTNPNYDPFQLQMRNFLLSSYYNRTNPAYINNLVNSSINNGTNEINASATPALQALRNSLAARGLSYSPVAGTAEAGMQAQRIGQITNLRAQAPLLADQLQGNALTSFSDYLSRLPVGQTSSSTGFQSGSGQSTTTGTGSVTNPGNILGGAVSGAGSALGLLYGQGAFDKK